MKAEHRRELNTNALADRMGRLVEGMKHTPEAGSRVIWIVGILAVAILATWYFASSASSWSTYWVRLDGETKPDALASIASDSRGTMPARAARFQLARQQLKRGLRSLYTPEQRKAALEALEDARRGFTELATECTESPLLAQEALFGAAQAEEALIGAPKPDHAEESRGSLDKVLALYHQIIDVYPKSYFVELADKRIRELETDGPAVVSFYKELNKLADAKKNP
jgi:hypothetical protein